MHKVEDRTFLIVDDDPEDRKILTTQLQRLFAGCGVHEACDARAARKTTGADRYTAIFVDFFMPNLDGLSILRELMLRCPETPIIMISGQTSDRVASDALKLGATDYVAKDGLNGEMLRRVVDCAIEKTALRVQLEAVLLEMRAFSHALVHDIRAPIRHIRFQCNEVLDGVRSGSRTQVLENLLGIDNSCKRMNALLMSLVEHIQADETGEVTSVDMQDVVQQCVEELSGKIELYKAKITIQSLPRAHGNSKQLKRLFHNLIENALTFRSDKETTIEISGTASQNRLLHFVIRDNGPGIEPNHLDEIFCAFRKLNSVRSVYGSGLGLATCRKIAQQHGGRIWCEAKIGVGSEFHLELPWRPALVETEDGTELSRLTRLLGESEGIKPQ